MTWAIKPQKPSDETLVFLPSRGEECVNLTVYSVDQDVSGGAAVTYLPCGNELATSHDEE